MTDTPLIESDPQMIIKPLIWTSGNYNIHHAHVADFPKFRVAIVEWDSGRGRDARDKYKATVAAFGATLSSHHEDLRSAQDWCARALARLAAIVIESDPQPARVGGKET